MSHSTGNPSTRELKKNKCRRHSTLPFHVRLLPLLYYNINGAGDSEKRPKNAEVPVARRGKRLSVKAAKDELFCCPPASFCASTTKEDGAARRQKGMTDVSRDVHYPEAYCGFLLRADTPLQAQTKLTFFF